MKAISVVIPTYNYGRFIGEAIDSVLAQTVAALEIIVVDDGSTDDTADVLAAYGDRIRVIRQTNQGVGTARNRGIKAARAGYIAFLDSDDMMRPRKLERDLARFDADPELGLVHCGAESFDNAGYTLAIKLAGLEGWVAPALLALDHEVIAAPGSGIAVPRRVAEEIGGFDPRLQPSEDWDFCYRIAVRYRVGFVAEPLLRYRLHGNGIHLNIPGMEAGMLMALEKAFRSSDPQVQSMRNHTYGRIHRVLAGCYFQSGEPRKFMRHMFKSLRYDPSNLSYFAAYPLRAAARAVAR